jgi:hypothetical protein
MYGISDAEVFAVGSREGWSLQRKLSSLLHPARVDLYRPLRNLEATDALRSAPFLAAFTAMRYASWARTAARPR